MRLESIARPVATDESLPLVSDRSLVRIDWEPMLDLLRDKTRAESERAGLFHSILANTICDISERIYQSEKFDYVGLTGGVFQNRLLTELVVQKLHVKKINCLLPDSIPANDGGLSYGQVIEFSASDKNID